MNLLVTGGAGFIGSHFIAQALQHPEVTRLVNLDCLTYAGDLRRLESAKDDPRYLFEKVDLRDQAEVLRVVRQHAITHVVHLAAETHVDRSIADPGAFIHTNVTGTFNLLEACRFSWQGGSGKVFLQVSTDEVYGSLGPEEPPFTEDSSLCPNSPYAASKAAADQLVRGYVKTYGFPAIVSRSSNNYGPGQHAEKFMPTVLRSLRQRQPIPLYGDGQNVRDWLHVLDHADALWLLLTSNKTGQVYNIGANDEWPNKTLVERLCDIFDQQQPECGGESMRLITFVADRLGHDRRYAINAAAMRKDLGWEPRRPMETGLPEAVRWYSH